MHVAPGRLGREIRSQPMSRLARPGVDLGDLVSGRQMKRGRR